MSTFFCNIVKSVLIDKKKVIRKKIKIYIFCTLLQLNFFLPFSFCFRFMISKIIYI